PKAPKPETSGFGRERDWLLPLDGKRRSPVRGASDVPANPPYRDLIGAQSLSLGDPPADTARQAAPLADVGGSFRAQAGNLAIMENGQIVELLLDRWRHADKLLEVVGHAPRTGQLLESDAFRLFLRQFLAERLLGGADVDAEVALGAGDAVDRSLGDQVA